MTVSTVEDIDSASLLPIIEEMVGSGALTPELAAGLQQVSVQRRVDYDIDATTGMVRELVMVTESKNGELSQVETVTYQAMP